MALTTAQKSNALGWPKPAELIELTGCGALETQDRAILNRLLEVAHNSGRLADPFAQWEISLAELRQGVSKHKGNERVRESIRRLMDVQVKVRYQGRQGLTEMRTHLIGSIKIGLDDTRDPTLRYRLGHDLAPIVERSGQWGRIRSEITFAMTSKYAIALYELISLRINKHDCLETFPIERFRELLGVPPKTYRSGQDFRRFVVEPAILEVNGLSNFGVAIDMQRRHTRAPVETVIVTWWKKDADDLRKAMREVNASKLGRKARLRGETDSVEYIPEIEV